MVHRVKLFITWTTVVTAVVRSSHSAELDRGTVRFTEVTSSGAFHPHRVHVRAPGGSASLPADLNTDYRSTLSTGKAPQVPLEMTKHAAVVPGKALELPLKMTEQAAVGLASGPENQEEPKHARIVITELKADQEDTTFSQISVFAATNSSTPTDITCRAYIENQKPEKMPKADAHFFICNGCNRGHGTNCTKDGCVISIGALSMDMRYFVWCLPEYQPLLPIYWPENIDVFPQSDEGLKVETLAKNPRELHAVVGVENLFAAFLMALYVWWSVELEHRCSFHASGFVVLIGIFCGGFVYYYMGKYLDFSYNMFSYFLLPMVIFSAGFQVRFSEMARCGKSIVLLGVFGTLLTFLVLYQFTNVVWTDFTHRGRLILSAALCATDTVASLAFLPQTMFPLAHIVVFGEGILNDIVSVLLASSIGKSHPGDTVEVGPVLMDAALCLLMSLFFGLLFGSGVIFFLQGWMGPMTKDGDNDGERPQPISALAMMLLLSYMSYVCAELFDASSILALFTCSVFVGHFSETRLPASIHKISRDITETIGTMADALVYGYFGLTAWSSLNGDYIMHNAWLIVALSAVILVTRAFVVYSFSTTLKFFHSTDMNHRDLVLTTMGGLTRGSIAYALILRNVPPPSFRTVADEQLVSTALGLMILNATLMSAIFPMVASRIAKTWSEAN
eukprot:gnl/MRDRNA2_/MRDRNA2_98372_c0_seq1.p1 gnl/MRDRNA2_/MRDRNA2_98372_c0~~gnl/MRDRNA2_/MRDRNA2_98372_c0_seq1.p1  ORF type:complete len:677 (-),score=87.41 gnl/MRDRNA2_/MRDRNA2_98372_c0_seq1:292-2322(-)